MDKARMHTRALPFIVAGLALAAGAAGAGWALTRGQEQSFRGIEVTRPYAAPDFTLTDQDGRPLRLSSLRGKAVLMFFGYTSCPDVCPTTLLRFERARKALGADAERVAFVMISVDPERDTPQRLKAHLEQYDPAIVGLTGTPGAVREVMERYQVVAEKTPVAGSAVGYVVNHSAAVYLVDPAGRVRVMFPFGASAEDYVHDVRLVL